METRPGRHGQGDTGSRLSKETQQGDTGSWEQQKTNEVGSTGSVAMAYMARSVHGSGVPDLGVHG